MCQARSVFRIARSSSRRWPRIRQKRCSLCTATASTATERPVEPFAWLHLGGPSRRWSVGCTGGSWTALHLSAPACHPRQARTARDKAVSGLGESSQRSSPVARQARAERTSLLSALMRYRTSGVLGQEGGGRVGSGG